MNEIEAKELRETLEQVAKEANEAHRMVQELNQRIAFLEHLFGIIHDTWDLMDSPDYPPHIEAKNDSSCT